jgi:hypothetical protein
VAEAEAAALRLCDGDDEDEAEGDCEGEAAGLADGDPVAEREPDALAVSEHDADAVLEPELVSEAVGLLLGDAPTLCVALGEPDREPVADTVVVAVCKPRQRARKREHACGLAREWARPDSDS